MTRAIGIDLGGTKIAAAVVDDEGRVRDRAERSTEVGSAQDVEAAVSALVSALDVQGCVGIGMGAAGIVDHDRGWYVYGPNTGLRDFDLRQVVSAASGLEAHVDNDANCAAWAEHRFGSGRGTDHFVCVTLGTGIGGGFVLDGNPYRGSGGGAAEIGHILADPTGPVCGCGRRGCWEQFASGQALERFAREGLADHRGSRVAELADGDPDEVRGPMVSAAGREGDAFALDLLARLGRWVGWGLASIVNVLAPERIAVSGGLVEDWDLIGPHASRALTERMEAPERRPAPELVAAELGKDAGVVGAAWLALSA